MCLRKINTKTRFKASNTLLTPKHVYKDEVFTFKHMALKQFMMIITQYYKFMICTM